VNLIPRTLTTRLVVTAVALVALVGVLVATSATLAMRGYLTNQLDGKVQDAIRRAVGPTVRFETPDGAGGVSSGGGPAFFQPGMVIVGTDPTTGDQVGYIIKEGAAFGEQPYASLPAATVRRLGSLPDDNHGHSVNVAGDHYRVKAIRDQKGNVAVIGLPAADIDSTLNSMLTWFALLTLLGVLIAGSAGTFLVRRQLRPLHQVADAAREVTTQDLSTGDTAILTRLPEDLTDEQTEVGQVGAALNTLLDHVDGALAARHKSEQQVRQFVADASHELRTPLSTIHGYAELSRRTPDDPVALGAALNKVETEAGRMSGLVEDLLLLARLDAGRPLVREDVDLTRLLLETVADARVLAPDHKWRLQLSEEPVTLVGDEARLHQVVTNLLNNARAHTPPGTTISVSASNGDGNVRLEVHDDGPGLPADLVPEVFDRFSRGDSSRTRASGGAGLGLSLVSAIAEAHGGTASVESRPGDTTFTVSLPVEASISS
jgi:two-component system OmpR family sensor kinase